MKIRCFAIEIKGDKVILQFDTEMRRETFDDEDWIKILDKPIDITVNE